jgi:hypothetical protein
MYVSCIYSKIKTRRIKVLLSQNIILSFLFYEKGDKQKTTILHKKKKQIFNVLSFLMQTNYFICQDDSDNIILMVEIINFQKDEMFLKICFFSASPVKLMICGLPLFTK